MEQVLDPNAAPAEPAVKEETAPTSDPFAMDESQLSALAPEARVAFDNVAKAWRSKAEEYTKSAAQKAMEETASKYRDYDENKQYANALRQLTSDPRFVQWYQSIQSQGLQQQQQQAMQVATAEDYALAVQEAAAGNPQRMQQIRMREFQALAAPALKEFNEMKVQQQQDREIDKLFKMHPDAEELDALGRTQDGEPSLLEWAVYDIVDKKGGTYEQAYQHAKRIADAMSKKSKDAALGLVNGKKQSVTEQVSQQSKETDNVIEVASGEEALRKNIEATMKGQKVTFYAKPRLARK
jgi:hypothetical protein